MAVDALMVPSMTRRFLAAIKKVTTKPVTRLVNTHHHIDHSGGNYLFREAEIVSHTYCREEIVRTGMPVDFFQKRIPRFAAEFPKLKLAVPEVTFEDRLVFYQAGREAKKRFDAGMTAEQAARDVKLGIYARWREPERILPNIMRLYQEFRHELDQPLDALQVFDGMRQLRAEWHGHGADEPDMCCI